MLRKLLSSSTNLITLPHQIKSLLTRVIPAPCLLCGLESPRLICRDCSTHFFSPPLDVQRCVSCALPILSHDTRCGECLKNPPAFDRTIVACDYVAPFDQLILALKFGHRLAVATAVAELMAHAVSNHSPQIELPQLLIAVPLSPQRLARRGFNQAFEIAKPLARLLNRPIYPHLLHRVRHTQAQTLLHPNQRHQNILHAFCPDQNYADKIAGRHIGVVDDVMTTGATLNEVAACLKRNGAARVSNIIFARTPPH